MSLALKRFLPRVALFSIPFLLYAMVVIAVDPFNYYGSSKMISTDLKEDVSLKVNYAMWKMLEYRKGPVPNILLGDSRMMSIRDKSVSEISHRSYSNLAYGGGSLREAIDTFWFAAECGPLENVYFGLNVNSYNARNNKDRVSEVLAVLGNPLLYFTNNNVLIAGQKLIKTLVMNDESSLGVPKMDRDTFWEYQLEVTTRIDFGNYKYPKGYREELLEISKFCKENMIDLNFVIFPNHVDLQKKIESYNLVTSSNEMRSDLEEMGRVFDFAFLNSITTDRDNYKDPYHFNQEVVTLIMESIWTEPSEFVKISGSPTIH